MEIKQRCTHVEVGMLKQGTTTREIRWRTYDTWDARSSGYSLRQNHRFVAQSDYPPVDYGMLDLPGMYGVR